MLLRLRIDMFTKVESLPIAYFDGRTHGEVMSHFTNDAETMREMIGNSLPVLVNSVLMAAGVFIMMLVLSWQLFLLVVLYLIVIVIVLQIVGGRSRNFYGSQQADLAAVNGYAEEYIEGQKVVKVYSHEPAVKAEFGFNSIVDFDV